MENSFPNQQLLYSADVVLGAKGFNFTNGRDFKGQMLTESSRHVFGSTVSLSGIQEQIIFKLFPL